MRDWVAKLLNAGDPSVSLKHTAFAVVVGSATGWLTYWLIRGPRDANWVAAFAALLAAVTTAKAMKSVDSKQEGQ